MGHVLEDGAHVPITRGVPTGPVSPVATPSSRTCPEHKSMKRAITMVVAAALFASLLAGSAVAQVDQEQEVENDAELDADIDQNLAQSNTNSQSGSATNGNVAQYQDTDQTNLGVQNAEVDQEADQEIEDVDMDQFGLDLF